MADLVLPRQRLDQRAVQRRRGTGTARRRSARQREASLVRRAPGAGLRRAAADPRRGAGAAADHEPTAAPPQRGAALLMAMVMLTLVSTLAAGMVWQQSRAIEVESAERTRAQAAWILTGALDWAACCCARTRASPGSTTSANPGPPSWPRPRCRPFWRRTATTTPKARPRPSCAAGSSTRRTRYNLRNLVDPATNKVVEAELAALMRLCETAAVAPETAQTLASGLQAALQAEKPGDGEADAAAAARCRRQSTSWSGSAWTRTPSSACGPTWTCCPSRRR